MTVEVRKVESKADYKVFFEFPWTLYKDDPNWTPQLLLMRRELFDRKKGPAWEYCEGDYFTAWRGDKIVGTIAAYINPRHNEFQEERVGWFGAFEVYDDDEAAAALFKTVGDWVKARGYSLMRGPQTFTTHDETGLLVDGFGPAVLLMPYNPQYYVRLIESNGFTKSMDMYSYYIDNKMMDAQGTLERLQKFAERQMKREGITVRGLTNQNINESFRLFKEMYNTVWAKNWGFTPMTEREFKSLIETLSIFVDKKLAYIAEVKGDPAGLILPVPDINQLLRYAYPNPSVPEAFSLIKALWGWKVRPVINGVRVPLVGVKEEYRLKGVPLVMFYYSLKSYFEEPRYQWFDAGWVLEHNKDTNGIMEMFGLLRYKTHRLYQKDL